MKTFITTLALCLATATAEDESAQYMNYIVQIQSNENRTTHKIDDVSPSGNANALRGVTESSIFQLWTIHRTKGTDYLLDEKTVSSYHPQAEITITSADPYQAVPRTRIDQPFTVTYKVNGLVTDNAEVQNAAKSVIFEHQVTSFGEDKMTADTSAQSTSQQSVIAKNGPKTSSMVSSITASDLTKARGEEIFTIYSRPDYQAEGSMLARTKVEVWPIASGSISGINTHKTYVRLPDIQIALVDLYPSSRTYVRIYEGSPTLTPANPKIINTSYVIIDDVVPMSREFALAGSETGILKAGSYTIEIIHETPFGAEILSQVFPLNKKSGIKVIGHLSSSE